MSNHIHLIVSAGVAPGLQVLDNDIKSQNNLSDIFRDFKKYTSKRIRECMNSLEVNESRREWMNERFEMAGAFWQEGIHPIVLESLDFTQQKLDYIHKNPVVAGYVWEPWEYRYSSARDYMTDQRGLLRVERLEL
jgi:putative transposase